MVSRLQEIREEIFGAAFYFSEVKVFYQSSVAIFYIILRNFSEHAAESPLSAHTMRSIYFLVNV